MKRFNQFKEASAEVADISVGKKKAKPTGVKADEPLKGYAYNEKEFKPHMMYDPKTGKGYKAEKPEDHERMQKLGYTHDKPEVKENYNQDLTLATKNIARLANKETGQDKKDYQAVSRALAQGNLGAVKKVIKGISTKEIQSDLLNILVGYNDLIAKLYPKAMAGGKFKSGMTVDKIIKEENMSLDDIKKKYAKEIIAFQDGGSDLSGGAKMAIMGYADLDSVKTDDPDELDKFVMGLQMGKYKKTEEQVNMDILLSMLEETNLDEALSPKEKEKRLQMIKRAVEKLNRANIEKVKKMAMRDMKAAGMFDDVLEEDKSAEIQKIQDRNDKLDDQIEKLEDKKARLKDLRKSATVTDRIDAEIKTLRDQISKLEKEMGHNRAVIKNMRENSAIGGYRDSSRDGQQGPEDQKKKRERDAARAKRDSTEGQIEMYKKRIDDLERTQREIERKAYQASDAGDDERAERLEMQSDRIQDKINGFRDSLADIRKGK